MEAFAERFGTLNALFTKLGYFSSQLQAGNLTVLTDLKTTQIEIDEHYRLESEKIFTLARTYQLETNEKARIYHHGLLKQNNKRSSILKLDTPNSRISGHTACFNYLENEVIQLLSTEHITDTAAENHLLNHIEPDFTDSDNDMLHALPTEMEV